MGSDGTDGPLPGQVPLGRRLLRLALLVGPAAATVGALVGVAVVAPAVGFGLLLVAVSVAGMAIGVLGQGSGLTTESLEHSHEIGVEVDRSNFASEVPRASLVTAYLYGVGGFGVLGIGFTAAFLL